MTNMTEGEHEALLSELGEPVATGMWNESRVPWFTVGIRFRLAGLFPLFRRYQSPEKRRDESEQARLYGRGPQGSIIFTLPQEVEGNAK